MWAGLHCGNDTKVLPDWKEPANIVYCVSILPMRLIENLKKNIFLVIEYLDFINNHSDFIDQCTVFDLISGLSAYVILGPKNRPN